MYHKNLSPSEILPSEHTRCTSELENLARQGKLAEAGAIYVVSVPKAYHLRAKYVAVDGHNRLESARRANVFIGSNVLQSMKDFNSVFGDETQEQELGERRKTGNAEVLAEREFLEDAFLEDDISLFRMLVESYVDSAISLYQRKQALLLLKNRRKK
ncbi:hypothetical protein HYX13_00535 [Candidatus Woesearchaeota archaeon]|nr:hypothetical protein [Candidatus Woesearchaeota archaeon]